MINAERCYSAPNMKVGQISKTKYIQGLVLQSKHVLLQNGNYIVSSPPIKGRPFRYQVKMFEIVNITQLFSISSFSNFAN